MKIETQEQGTIWVARILDDDGEYLCEFGSPVIFRHGSKNAAIIAANKYLEDTFRNFEQQKIPGKVG